MTAQDGAQILTAVQELTALIQGFSNRIAILQQNNLTILEYLARIDSGLAETRAGRLEIELRETEMERDLAEQRLKSLEEKLDLKKNVSHQAADTKEKIRQGSAAVIADLERQRRDEFDAWLRGLKRDIVKAVLISLSVGGVTAAIAFIWWLIQLYINR